VDQPDRDESGDVVRQGGARDLQSPLDLPHGYPFPARLDQVPKNPNEVVNYISRKIEITAVLVRPLNPTSQKEARLRLPMRQASGHAPSTGEGNDLTNPYFSLWW
jgi:hypothetical protein